MIFGRLPLRKGRDNMNNVFIVPTGNIIKEYLSEYGITQKELANRMNISEKHISNVLKGKSRLTEEFALKLEKILTGTTASYWLNYETKYREDLARKEETLKIRDLDLEEISRRFRFKEVFKGLDISLIDQAIEMLKLLKISDFHSFESVYENININFMEDGGEKEAIAIWLNLCEEEIEIQNSDIDSIQYTEVELRSNLKKFKLLSNNNVTASSIDSARRLCNKLGIYLVVCPTITNSKVRGALTTYKKHPTIYISERYRSHSNTWFALAHEIGHLLCHYQKDDTLISYENEEINDKEKEANEFARDFFIDPIKYEAFVQRTEYLPNDIKKFAKEQGTLPEFVVARLQHDQKIGHDKYNYL